jgi:hypothetical protein
MYDLWQCMICVHVWSVTMYDLWQCMICIHVWSVYMYDLCTCMICDNVWSVYMYDLWQCMICVHVWSLAEFLEWEIFQTQVAEKIKTHFMIRNFFPKIVPFMRYNLNALFSSTQWSDTSYVKDNCLNTKKLNKKFRAEFRDYLHIAQFCSLAYLLFLLLPFHFKFF